MKIEVTLDNIARALNSISRVTGIRSTLPILNNVLLKTEKGRLQLSVTDLEIGATTWIGAKIEKEGAFTVPARLLTEYVAAGTGKTIRLEKKEAQLSVQTDQGEATIKGLPADEFPLIPETENSPLFTLATPLLKEALKKTVGACAQDEARPALSGVLFWKKAGLVRLTATDSYRLAEVQIALPPREGSKTEQETKIIVPQRAVTELVRLLENGDNEISVVVSEAQSLFRAPSFLLVSRLIAGEFPNYIDIIPDKEQTRLKVETKELQRAVKVAALFAREVGNHITLVAHPSGGLTVRAASPQIGENETKLAASVSGEELTVAFNARYLTEALGSINSKMTDIALTGKTSPAVFREEDNSSFLHLVMPLRVE